MGIHKGAETRGSYRYWLGLSLMFLVAIYVPRWSVLLVLAAAAEIVAIFLDVWDWLSARCRLSSRKDKTSLSKSEALRKFTWQELRQHNTAASLWVAVHDKVYDVTDFLYQHPGGRELLLLAAGRDATNLFESYHPFTKKPALLLEKFLIGELVTFEHPRFREDGGFYRECRERVKEYFEKTGQNSKNPSTAFFRMSGVYVVLFLAFWLMYSTKPIYLSLRVCFAIIFGISQAMPLLHWMHDASHASIGNSENWWWYVGRISLDWISGSSMVAWRNQHVIGHHIYTNVLGSDPDLPVALKGDPRRLLPQQVWSKIYRYQHIYLPPLYGILGLKSRIQDVTDVFLKGTNGPIRVNPISTQDILRQVASKSFWLFIHVIVPYCFLEQPVSRLTALFFISEFMTGYWLAFNFQVSHISLDADYFVNQMVDDHSSMIDEEWAKLQVKTSVDYAQGSVFDTFFSGALNYQTTHHLFPSVSQYHYPQIAPIIMDICRKYGVTYNVMPSYGAAIRAHYNHLKKMGREGKSASLKLD